MLTPRLDAPMLGASNVLFGPGYLGPRSLDPDRIGGRRVPSSLLSSGTDLEHHAVEAASFVSRADVHNGGRLDPVVILGVGLKKVF